MENIKLLNGLIAFGYAGKIDNSTQTKFSICLANKLAEKEKVLFLNWNSYNRKIEKLLENSDTEKNKNLDINTSIEYFGLSSFLEIIELIEKHNYSTIFIDNFYSFTSEELEINDYGNKNTVIKSLDYLTKKFNIRVVFNLSIDPQMFSYNYNVDENEIDLAFFKWSRKIINDCSQILAIQNINGFLDGETGETYDNENFKVFELKNNNDKININIIKLK